MAYTTTRKKNRRPNNKKIRRYRKTKTGITKQVNIRRDTFFFTRMCSLGPISAAPGNVAYGAFEFKLSDLPGNGDFQNLFDYYKITGVRLRLNLRYDNTTAPFLQSSNPRLWYCTDYDDSIAPSGAQELRERQDCKFRILNPDRSVNIFLRPKPLVTVYNSLASVGYSIGKSQWIDMATPALPHYALKYAIEDITQTGGMQVIVEAKYYLAMKGTR